MIALFSDILACRANALTRVDARVKLPVALGAVGLALLATRPHLPLALLGGSAAAAIALGLPAGLLLGRMLSPVGGVGVLVLLKSLMGAAPFLLSVPLGPWQVALSREGAGEGLRIGWRVLGASGVLVLFGAVTPAHRVFHALRWLRLPDVAVEVALLMYRYVFVLLEAAEDVAQAQRVRLGWAGPRRAAASAAALAGTVLLRAVDQAGRTDEAMRLRLYRGRLPFAPLAPLSRRDRAVLLSSLAALGALFALLERGLP